LINRLKKQEENLIQIDRQEKRFQSMLNIDGTDKGIMYRELALLMETHDQIDAAELFMRKAALYRPSGSFIKEKHREYERKLGHGNLAYKKSKINDSMNENKQNQTFPGLSKKKQALTGIGIAGGAIGVFNLLKRRR